MERGRQKRSYCHSPSKGYDEGHGSGDAGMWMGCMIGYGGGEGETGIEDFPLSMVFIILQA